MSMSLPAINSKTTHPVMAPTMGSHAYSNSGTISLSHAANSIVWASMQPTNAVAATMTNAGTLLRGKSVELVSAECQPHVHHLPSHYDPTMFKSQTNCTSKRKAPTIDIIVNPQVDALPVMKVTNANK